MLVIEGAMGLFDGDRRPPGRTGAAADLAARFGLPVLLVLDVSGQSQIGGRGRARASPRTIRRCSIAGVVLNASAASGIARLIADALEPLRHSGARRDPARRALALPERHLGLVQAGEHGDLDARLARLADLAERHLDLDAILDGSRRSARHVRRSGRDAAAARPAHRARPGRGLHLRLSACARWLAAGRRGDRAVLAAGRRGAAGGLRRLLAARRLSRAACRAARGGAQRFRDGLRASPRRGRCTASAAATWCSARRWRMPTASATRMAGLLGHATSFAKRKLHLGYREARLLARRPARARRATSCAATSSTTRD